MSVTGFIPELWSRRINQKLRESLVFGSVVNTDYEGEIGSGGDTVKINSIGDVTIGTYTPNSTSITPEQLNDYQTTLAIDQKKYFAFKVDDVDKAQINANVMDEAMQSAAWGLKNAADEYIAALYTDAGNTITSTAIDSTNVLASVLTLGQYLSQENVPEDGRWLVIPPWFKTKLLLAKALVTDNGAAADAFTNGKVGRVGGFDLYESNNVSNNGTTYYIMAGSKKAISFAAQVNKVEAYRPEASFSDAVKGLYVYGAKVVYPDALAVLTATVGSEP
jgi:hypothetical protein